MAKIAVIGYGTIGAHLVQIAREYEHEVILIMTRKGIRDANGMMILPFSEMGPNELAKTTRICAEARVRYAMLAIPSGGAGTTEADYIKAFVGIGCKVVTAGKSALANQFDLISPHMRQIGFDAALGGGTGMPTFLSYALKVHPKHPFVLTMVCNGTLNYCQTKVLEGWLPESICKSALDSGYAEKPENGEALDALTLYRGESDDVRRKIAVALNTRMRKLIGRTVNQWDLHISELTASDLRVVMSANARYRYLVRICSRDEDLEFFEDIQKIGGSIKQRIGELTIAAGFVNVVAGSALDKWLPLGAGNAALLAQNGDPNLIVGEGAGAVPTVGAMMSNLGTFIDAE